MWTPQSYLLSDLKGLLRHDPTSLDIILENLLHKTAPTKLSNVFIPLPDLFSGYPSLIRSLQLRTLAETFCNTTLTPSVCS